MSLDGAGQGSPDHATASQTWRTGRRYAWIFFSIVAGGMVAALVVRVTAEPGHWFVAGTALNVVLIALAAYGALTEFKGRVEVDATAVHRVTALRRQTYPRHGVVAVRQGRREKGMLHAELVLHSGGVVELPNSGERVGDLRRWRASASAG